MDSSFTIQSQKSLLWRILYCPMLIVSLLLHTAVLFLPLPAKPEPVAEAEETENSVEVSLSSLIAPQTAPPTPQDVARPSPPPQPQIAAPPVQQIAQPIYTSPKAPQESVSQAPETPSSELPEAPTETATTQTLPQTTIPAAPVETPFDPLPNQEAFAASLGGLEGSLPFLPQPSALSDPEYFFATPDDNNSDLLPGISHMQWLNDQQADDVFSTLQAQSQQTGVQFVEVPEGYGGGSLYELQNDEGQTFFYVNIVPGKGGVSTILVTWNYDPNQPPPDPTAIATP